MAEAAGARRRPRAIDTESPPRITATIHRVRFSFLPVTGAHIDDLRRLSNLEQPEGVSIVADAWSGIAPVKIRRPARPPVSVFGSTFVKSRAGSTAGLRPGCQVVEHNTFAAALDLGVEVFHQQPPPNFESVQLLRGQIPRQRLLQPWSRQLPQPTQQ